MKENTKCEKCNLDNFKVIAVTIKTPISNAVLQCLNCGNEWFEEFTLEELFDIM